MTKQAHTPGPWAYRPQELDDWGIVRAPVTEPGLWSGGVICQARDPEALDAVTLARHRMTETDPWEANARLIAAAPDLLQSAVLLESLCTWLLHAFGPDSPAGKEAAFRATQARAAITKATPEDRS